MTKLLKERFRLSQTIVTIHAYRQELIEVAKRSIRQERAALETFIVRDEFFMHTLEPYDKTVDGAPDIVVRMVKAGQTFGTGPMAAVAGAIAQKAVEAMIDEGATFAMVENGGDICILNDQDVLVGLYAGTSTIKDLALDIPAREVPIGICTSSGTVGPSISFGFADSATVIAKDAFLADAAATALGNVVTSKVDLKNCFKTIEKDDVYGALVVFEDEMAVWGEVPRIVRAKMRSELITRG